jgi:hypothetical protein
VLVVRAKLMQIEEVQQAGQTLYLDQLLPQVVVRAVLKV